MADNKIKVEIKEEVGNYIEKAITILKNTPWKTKQDLRSANGVYRYLQMAQIALEKNSEQKTKEKALEEGN